MNLSQNHLAINLGVDIHRINAIVLVKHSLTADTALRLARFFGMSYLIPFNIGNMGSPSYPFADHAQVGAKALQADQSPANDAGGAHRPGTAAGLDRPSVRAELIRTASELLGQSSTP